MTVVKQGVRVPPSWDGISVLYVKVSENNEAEAKCVVVCMILDSWGMMLV